MANKEVGDWDPMAEAHKNPIFNTYVEGPGASLDPSLQPCNRGTGRTQRSGGGRSDESQYRLHITNIPAEMTEVGLKHLLIEWAMPRKVYIHRNISNATNGWGIAEFDTFGDAEVAMRGCNDKPPYNLQVKFAKTREERNSVRVDHESRDSGRQDSGPAFPAISNSNNPSSQFQAMPPKSLPNVLKPRGVVNVNPQQRRTPSHGDNTDNHTPKNAGQCGVCRANTTGRCGACRSVWYCSQACANSDFMTHFQDCYIPIPAVCFDEDKPSPSSFSKPVGNLRASPKESLVSPNNKNQYQNGGVPKSSSEDGNKAVGYRNGAHCGFKRENFNSSAENLNPADKPFGNEDRRPNRNGPNNGDGQPMARKSVGGKQTNDRQDKAGSLSNPAQNRQGLDSQAGQFSKQGNYENKLINNAKRQIWIGSEELDPDVYTEVEVSEVNNYGLFVTKPSNSTAMEVLHKALGANWSSMLPLQQPQDGAFCAALFQGGCYRAKILKNTKMTPGIRVKYIDYGNVGMVSPQEIKALPETFLEPQAQAIHIKSVDGTPAQYKGYRCNSLISVKPIEKVQGAWNVAIKPMEGKSIPSVPSPSPEVAQPSSPAVAQPSSPAVAQPSSPAVARPSPEDARTSPAVAATSPVVAGKGMSPLATAATEKQEIPTEELPLDSYTTMTITEVKPNMVVWANITSKNDMLETMMAQLNSCLDAKPLPCELTKKSFVAVRFEEYWHRAIVLKVAPNVVHLGLIDYGQIIDIHPDMTSSLPDNFRVLPAQAIKLTLSEPARELLQVDHTIDVKAQSTKKDTRGCIIVDVKSQTNSSHQEIKKETKLSDPIVTGMPSASPVPTDILTNETSITSLAVQELPAGVFTEVTVTVASGMSLWVNIKANSHIMEEMSVNLFTTITSNLSPCQPKVGDLVAALFEGYWYRAKVLTVAPKLRMMYIDYGNESDVTADEVNMLPKQFATLPAQAIKITFSTTSSKYSDLKEDSVVCVKPVTGAEKTADGSVTVEVQGDADIQATPEAPAKLPVQLEEPVSTLRAEVIPSGTYTMLSVMVPGKIGWVTLEEYTEILNKMMMDLNLTLKCDRRPCQPKVGQLISAIFDEYWHRARVLSVEPELQVFYIDYGNIRNVSLDDIGVLPPEFVVLPAQAIKVTYMEGTPPKYFSCPELTTFRAKLHDKMPDGTVILEVEEEAVAVPDAEQAIHESPIKAASVTTTSPDSSKTDHADGNSQELPCSMVENLSSESVDKVIVTESNSGQLWVNLTSKSNDLENVMAKLLDMQKSLQPCIPKVGDFVAAFCTSLNLWHRAKVLSVAGTFRVLYIDYGLEEDLIEAHVRALPEEVTNLPAQGIKIQLCAGTPEKFLHLNIDDTIQVRLLAKIMDGSSIVTVVDN